MKIWRQGSWILISTVITGIFNYVSSMFVGRVLGPVEYGIFASLNSFSLVLGVVAGIVQTVVTNYVARRRSEGSMAEIRALLVGLLRWLLLSGVAGAMILALASRPLASFLQIPSILPVLAISTFLIPTAVLPLVNGVLRGLQRFGALGGTQISVGMFRLAASVGLISLGLGATGAVAALPLASLAAIAVGMLFLRDVFHLRGTDSMSYREGLFEYSAYAALSLICFAVLTNIDVILVKSRFTPLEAGVYSSAATLGKITLWLPRAAVVLLLPKAAERDARGEPSMDLVRKSLLGVVLLCGAVTVVFFCFPSLIVETLFGEHYRSGASLLGLYGLSMTFGSLVNVWLVYYLALQDKYYAYILLGGTVLLLALLSMFCSTLISVVATLIGVGLFLYLGGEVLLAVRRRSHG